MTSDVLEILKAQQGRLMTLKAGSGDVLEATFAHPDSVQGSEQAPPPLSGKAPSEYSLAEIERLRECERRLKALSGIE